MNRTDASRRRLDRALWAAVVVVAALLLPLVPVLVSSASAPDAAGSAPSAEESSAALNGVQRLLHAAISLRFEPLATIEATALHAESAALVAAGLAPPLDRSGSAVSVSAGENRRL